MESEGHPQDGLLAMEPADAGGLAEFVEALRDSVATRPELWENVTLDAFLDAFSRVLQDHRPHLLAGHGEGSLPYAVLAKLLHSAAIYE